MGKKKHRQAAEASLLSSEKSPTKQRSGDAVAAARSTSMGFVAATPGAALHQTEHQTSPDHQTSPQKKRKKEGKHDKSKKIKLDDDERIIKNVLNSSSESSPYRYPSPSLSTSKPKMSKQKNVSSQDSPFAADQGHSSKSISHSSQQISSPKKSKAVPTPNGVSPSKKSTNISKIAARESGSNSDNLSGNEYEEPVEEHRTEAMDEEETYIHHQQQHHTDDTVAENVTNEGSDHAEEEGGKSSGWSLTETEELVYKMREMLPSADHKSFKARLYVFKWGSVSQQLSVPRAPEDCRLRVQKIMEICRQTRNLDEMLASYQRQETTRKVVGTPLQRFMKDKHDDIKNLGGNFLLAARQLYQALPEEERSHLYVQPHLRETRATKPLVLQCHSSLHYYGLKHPSLSRKDLKERFQALSEKKKLSCINSAVEELRQAKVKFQQSREQNPDRPVKEPHNHISKDEWKLVLQRAGMPMLPVSSALQLYSKGEQLPPTSTAKEGLARYNTFTKSMHYTRYRAEFNQLLQQFSGEYQAWRAECDDPLLVEQGDAYHQDMTFVKKGKDPKSSKPPKPPKMTTTRKIANKLQDLEDNFVEPSMVGSFKGEPKAPPITPREVLRDYLKDKGGNAESITKVYRRLSEENKNQCIKVAGTNVQEYKEALKNFVSELPDREQYIYIGQNRVRYIRVFEGCDIFENDYPCAEYPPFRTPSKQHTDKGDGNFFIKKENLNTTANQIDIEELDTILESASTDSDDRKKSKKKGGQVSAKTFQTKLQSTSTPRVKESERTEMREEDSDEDSDKSSNYTQLVQPKVHTRKILNNSNESEEEEEECVSSKEASSKDSSSEEEEDGKAFNVSVRGGQVDIAGVSIKQSPASHSKQLMASPGKPTKASASMKSPSKPAPTSSSSDSGGHSLSESEDSSESEEDERPSKGASDRNVSAGRAAASACSSSEEESDDDDAITEAWA